MSVKEGPEPRKRCCVNSEGCGSDHTTQSKVVPR